MRYCFRLCTSPALSTRQRIIIRACDISRKILPPLVADPVGIHPKRLSKLSRIPKWTPERIYANERRALCDSTKFATVNLLCVTFEFAMMATENYILWRRSKITQGPTKTKFVRFESGMISLRVEGGDVDLRRLDDMNRSRRHRKGMPCKQARRDVSGDVPKALLICKERSMRVDVNNNNLDTEVREMRANRRYRRRRCDRSGPPRNVSGIVSSSPYSEQRTRLSSTGKVQFVAGKNLSKKALVPSTEILRTRSCCLSVVRMRQRALRVRSPRMQLYWMKIGKVPDRIVLIWTGFRGPTVMPKSKRVVDANMMARHFLQTCARLNHTYFLFHL
jgi:hypothetical protein